MEGERSLSWTEADNRENNSSQAEALPDVMSALVLEEKVFTNFMELPTEMALKVLMFVDPEDLLKVAQTCATLRSLSENDKLWDEKSKQEGFNFSLKSEDKELLGRQDADSSFKFSRLKTNFIKHFRIRANFRLNPIRQQVLQLGISNIFSPKRHVEFVGDKIIFTTPTRPFQMKMFDPMTGECLPFLGSRVLSAISVESPFIVSGIYENSLTVWNAETREILWTLQGHTDQVWTLQGLHLFNQILVSGSRDASVRLWNIVEGTCLNVFTGHLEPVTCVQYNGRLVASGSADCTVKIWNPNTGECLHTLAHPQCIMTVYISGNYVVSSCYDEVRVWDLETGTCEYRLEGNVMKLKGNTMVSRHPDMTVKIWDTPTWSCLNTLEVVNSHSGANGITAIDFNDQFVVTGSRDGEVKLLNIKTGQLERFLLVLEGSKVEEIRMNETSVVCATQSVDKKIDIHVLNFGIHRMPGEGGDESVRAEAGDTGGACTAAGASTGAAAIGVSSGAPAGASAATIGAAAAQGGTAGEECSGRETMEKICGEAK